MEGELLKWTNYFSGWQPRWFILSNGVLSYYKSQEDVRNGCKGSIKMAVCDIAVHPTDTTRLDLTIPGEQYYYIKSNTSQDRQSWLIALGSSKAAYSEFTSSANQNADKPDLIKTKQSELRLYCDLLMQQVHSVKQMVSRSDGVMDVEKLTEASTLILATCDTFIVTLGDCMKLVPVTPVLESTHHHVLDSSFSSSQPLAGIQRLQSTRPLVLGPVEHPARHRPSSVSSIDGIKIHTSSHYSPGLSSRQHEYPITPHLTVPHSSLPPEPMHVSNTSPVIRDLNFSPVHPPLPSLPVEADYQAEIKTVNGITHHTDESNNRSLSLRLQEGILSSATDVDNINGIRDAASGHLETFFSTMPCSFADVDTSQEDCVLAVPFLKACKNLVPIFDKLGSTLTPVKMDFCGNIRKIEHKYESSSGKFQTLQALVLSEVENNQHTNSDSATSALLWLKRSLEFITEFLKECISGCMDMGMCAGNAYSRTLKRYHGWVVRGIFSVAVRALPYRETFIGHLVVGDGPDIDTSSQQFEEILLLHVKSFVSHLSRVLDVLQEFYIRHKLDSSDTV